MTSTHKTGTIIVLWIAGLVMMGMLTNNEINVGSVILGVFVFAGVIGSTIAITQSAAAAESAEPVAMRGRSKMKNSDAALVDRLIDSMSEEELSALRRRLGDEAMTVGDDGELVSIARR